MADSDILRLLAGLWSRLRGLDGPLPSVGVRSPGARAPVGRHAPYCARPNKPLLAAACQAAGLVLASAGALANAEETFDFSVAQVAQIRSLGPWPPAQAVDPTNAVSGVPGAIELGRRLFRDPRMSPVGYIGCVTCHQPDRAFTDLRARAHGLADLPRNTPGLANLRQQRWYGRDGASDSLWMASIRPMLDPREFDGNPTSITRIFERDPELAACYRSVFGRAPVTGSQRTIADVGKALAAFQETLTTGPTAFDAFRQALAQGDRAGMAAYPVDARRGLRLFVGSAGCIACHKGPNFSDDRFHAVLPLDRADNPGRDDGRVQGLRALRESPFNLLGAYNDDPARTPDRTTKSRVGGQPTQSPRGQFRTPSLRNVAVTAPYMHDGRHDRLHEALDHGRQVVGPARDAGLTATALAAAERDDLAAFLRSLTDAHGERRPWSTQALANCP